VTQIAGLELDELLALRDLDRDGVRRRFGAVDVADDVAYEQLRPVDCLSPQEFEGHFYFRGDHQVMLYVGRAALAGADLAAVKAELGDPEAKLASRAGSESAFWVYPQRGVAFSTDGSSVELLEVFPPTTLERYKSEIYEDPGEFIR
jgi:hypothetical protein